MLRTGIPTASLFFYNACKIRICIRLLIQHTRAQDAGWSSLVARQAHNLKAAGSNPAPATNFSGGRSSFASDFIRVVSECREPGRKKEAKKF